MMFCKKTSYISYYVSFIRYYQQTKELPMIGCFNFINNLTLMVILVLIDINFYISINDEEPTNGLRFIQLSAWLRRNICN